MGILASGIAHEFNNLLTGVFINIEPITIKTDKKSTQHTYVLEAQKALGKILLMDTEPIIHDSIGSALKYLGYQVDSSYSGEEALKTYSEDMTVPGMMDGKECTERLLRLDPQARVILSSGYSNDP